MRRCSTLVSRLQRTLDSRTIKGKLRGLIPYNPSLVDFSSNDYLGISRDKLLAHRIGEKYEEYMNSCTEGSPLLGSTGSRLLTGNLPVFTELERYIAIFHGFKHSLLANSGWDLNYGLCSAIASKETIVVYDELCHNSLVMGIRAGRQKTSVSFTHNSIDDLSAKLSLFPADQEKLIVVESVYSMDGDVCPLVGVMTQAACTNSMVLIDEAHSFGMYGAKGEGLVGYLGLQSHPSLLGVVCTYGKACGLHGASLVTDHEALINTMLNYSKPLVYSTSLSIHTAIALHACYDHIAVVDDQRAKVFQFVNLFRSTCEKHGVQTIPSVSPIQGVVIPTNEGVLRAFKFLLSKGMSCLPIRAPTVPEGQERIRIIIHAHNTEEQILELCEALASFTSIVT